MAFRRRQPGVPIDWADLHRRLDVAGAALDRRIGPTEDEARTILATRAAALARPVVSGVRSAPFRVVVFVLEGERYGVEARLLVEVVRLTELARLPGGESGIAAVMAWRGEVLPVMELRSATGPGIATDRRRYALVLGRQHAEFALVADEVLEVLALREDAIRPWAKDGETRMPLLRGLTDDAVLVLDTERLLALQYARGA